MCGSFAGIPSTRAPGLVVSAILAWAAAHGAGAPPSPDLFIGGAGGVYFLAEPGTLEVEVVKRDRNKRDRVADLRAILFGPDRRVLGEARIPDDGRPAGSGLGPPRSVRLSARVERGGVYGVNVTVSGDRYGDEAVWGIRSNCRRYLIETARGHRDERHQEPIVLAGGEIPATVCFQPRAGKFEFDASVSARDGAEVRVLDDAGSTAGSFPVKGGKASGGIPGGGPRGAGPWRLVLPTGTAIVNIDGVTRWDRGDAHPDMACWTPDPVSWFPFLENRWLLTPYRRIVYRQPGAEGRIAFLVHNNGATEKVVDLRIEFASGAWPARLGAEKVTLKPGKAARVELAFTTPASGERSCHIRATPADDPTFSTYSTLTVRAGDAPASKALALPIVLKPYEHENEQFGYLPEYPVDNEVYFGADNRTFEMTGSQVAGCRDGRWSACRLAAKPEPGAGPAAFAPIGTKLAFDARNRMYALASCRGRPALLCSADDAGTFDACAVPPGEKAGGAFDIENFTGQNASAGPPPILRYILKESDPARIWRRVHDLDLFLPAMNDGRLSFGRSVRVSTNCIGLASHSGMPASVVSRGDRVHVCWAEATDPAVKVPGVPTFVATYDRAAALLGRPALVGYGPPANDIHNSPSITMDSKGYLHVLAGTHGRPFPYARSLKPEDAGGGWTPAEPTGPDIQQTYIGMVCGPDDSLHTAFRLWQRGKEPFPASYYATLACQRKRPGQPWEPPRILVVPPMSEYSVFYHRLTIDRRGRLFLSYEYWSTFWFYRNDQPARRRALLVSDDGGDTWKFADSRDLCL